MTAHFVQFPCLVDNYGVLVHDSSTGATASIDAPDAEAVLAALDAQGWTLTDILVTHHHADHVQGLRGLKARFPDVRVVAPAKEAARIGGVDLTVSELDTVRVGELAAKVIETPGHTAGHIVYWFEAQDTLFAGDTLFALGCGRVLETPLDTMYDSLMKLTHLPLETNIYAGHEYTVSNARFALTVDPTNVVLKERAAQVEALRAEGKPTLPTTLAIELATNPFLRADNPDVQAAVGMAGADPAAVFADLRERKNKA
ncbi:hydroxyacylglutathione hydrolase [Lichenihabitans sp. PAMC28606]|uniref:hydroxyacylglutathione hydrolase n=1 Tax=Lichenihabitans sp. PAMC28606 TaxID=2880932 RepID=UPI001D0A8F06|nr:hydroxyacylglutathione hydrolase [Lichenihabitans sp. PAMC28606]UDL93348.1 hydroxyacylglutathione hydrolase [Lichenihabitans sp. PAMC28606]